MPKLMAISQLTFAYLFRTTLKWSSNEIITKWHEMNDSVLLLFPLKYASLSVLRVCHFHLYTLAMTHRIAAEQVTKWSCSFCFNKFFAKKYYATYFKNMCCSKCWLIVVIGISVNSRQLWFLTIFKICKCCWLLIV